MTRHLGKERRGEGVLCVSYSADPLPSPVLLRHPLHYANAMGERHEVHFVREDVTIEVDEDDYLLAEAERAGLDLPYSCRMGTCSVCACRVEGEVDQSEGVVLTDGEKEEGFCLICIAKPRGRVEVHTDEVP